MQSSKRFLQRGEIWFSQLSVDPSDKRHCTVVVISLDARNRHERADTVLVVPLTPSIHKDVPTHVYLSLRAKPDSQPTRPPGAKTLP